MQKAAAKAGAGFVPSRRDRLRRGGGGVWARMGNVDRRRVVWDNRPRGGCPTISSPIGNDDGRTRPPGGTRELPCTTTPPAASASPTGRCVLPPDDATTPRWMMGFGCKVCHALEGVLARGLAHRQTPHFPLCGRRDATDGTAGESYGVIGWRGMKCLTC